MIDGDTIVHPYASTRLFAWEDPMGCPKRHGATGVEQNINYDDLCSKKAPRFILKRNGIPLLTTYYIHKGGAGILGTG